MLPTCVISWENSECPIQRGKVNSRWEQWLITATYLVDTQLVSNKLLFLIVLAV